MSNLILGGYLNLEEFLEHLSMIPYEIQSQIKIVVFTTEGYEYYEIESIKLEENTIIISGK